MDQYVISYSVLLPCEGKADKYRWKELSLLEDPEFAGLSIRELHPDMKSYRINSICSKKLAENAGPGAFCINLGDNMPPYLEGLWRSIVPVRKRPEMVEKAEADFRSYAQHPEFGWWDLYLLFFSPIDSPNKFAVQILICCSDVYDPRKDLLRFLGNIKENLQSAIVIDEEGGITALESWPIDDKKIHLCITSNEYKYIQYNFIVDKEGFVESIRNTYEQDFANYLKCQLIIGEDSDSFWHMADEEIFWPIDDEN